MLNAQCRESMENKLNAVEEIIKRHRTNLEAGNYDALTGGEVYAVFRRDMLITVPEKPPMEVLRP